MQQLPTPTPFPTTPDPLLWIRYSRIVLFVVGTAYILFGLGMSALFLFMPDNGGEQPPLAIRISMAAFALLITCGFGGFNFAAAVGLKRRQKWAWFSAVILGGIYAPSCCLPFGVVLLYAMLQKGMRDLFAV